MNKVQEKRDMIHMSTDPNTDESDIKNQPASKPSSKKPYSPGHPLRTRVACVIQLQTSLNIFYDKKNLVKSILFSTVLFNNVGLQY